MGRHKTFYLRGTLGSMLLYALSTAVIGGCGSAEDKPKALCTKDADCDDGFPATVDKCTPNGCVHICVPGSTDASCDSCAPGFQDEDGDGICKPDCYTAQLPCAPEDCSDLTGTAVCCEEGKPGLGCDGCGPGKQDRDGDGICKPRCSTAGLSCGHGTCTDESGTALCKCEEPYDGAGCDICANGYQDNDHDGICSPTCAKSGLQCGHGDCVDYSGTPRCYCGVPSYTGPTCSECSTGFQDNDGDGICAPTCQTSGIYCGPKGTCSDAGNTVVCICPQPYLGENCERCAAGYWMDVYDGLCKPN